ncbi:MAG: STAS domain-containing protein [Anaerolineae bacterium]|jgi:anti-sigma B factor antagonist|nr:STAS domain-containing protein [Anaerolineae bacterium]
MKLSPNTYKHCDLIKIEGRVDSSTAPQLAEALNTITDNGRYRIVLDFSKVEFISSAGLRVLINTQKNCKRYNRGEVVLAELPKNIYAALDLAGFTMLFKIFDNVIEAVASF